MSLEALFMIAVTALERRILEALRVIGPGGIATSAPQTTAALEAALAPELNVHPGDLREPILDLRKRGFIDLTPKFRYGHVFTISDHGIRSLGELEAAEAEEAAKAAASGAAEAPIIFVSCGQWSDEEKSIGRALAQVINADTIANGFFAENKNSLGALTAEILTPLSKCVGVVAVMHHRGNVNLGEGHFVRGSVWIEQEIAMAALLKQVYQRDIRILLYTNVTIELEGIRQQLLIHAIPFKGLDDIVADFRKRLQTEFAEFLKPQVYLTARPLQACEPAENQKETHLAYKTDLVLHNDTDKRYDTVRLQLVLPPGWGPIRWPSHKVVDVDPVTHEEPDAPADTARFSLLLKGPYEPKTDAPVNDLAFAAPGRAAAPPRVLWRIDHGGASTPAKGSPFALLGEKWP